MMDRQYSGAAIFEFRREGEAWVVVGHFFDDIGRSGQVSLAQVLPGASITLSRTSGASGPEQVPAAAVDPAGRTGPGQLSGGR
jgi:hypothetical protein